MLHTLLHAPQSTTVSAFTRKPLSPEDPRSLLRPIVNSDSSAWPNEFPSLSPAPSIFYSGLGTTRANAGSFAALSQLRARPLRLRSCLKEVRRPFTDDNCG